MFCTFLAFVFESFWRTVCCFLLHLCQSLCIHEPLVHRFPSTRVHGYLWMESPKKRRNRNAKRQRNASDESASDAAQTAEAVSAACSHISVCSTCWPTSSRENGSIRPWFPGSMHPINLVLDTPARPLPDRLSSTGLGKVGPPAASWSEYAFRHELMLRVELAKKCGHPYVPLTNSSKEMKHGKMHFCWYANKRVKKCSGCRWAYYCCRTCQRSDWKRHREICNPDFQLPAHVTVVGIPYVVWEFHM